MKDSRQQSKVIAFAPYNCKVLCTLSSGLMYSPNVLLDVCIRLILIDSLEHMKLNRLPFLALSCPLLPVFRESTLKRDEVLILCRVHACLKTTHLQGECLLGF